MRHLPVFLTIAGLALPSAALAQGVPGTTVAEMFCMARVAGDMSMVEGSISTDLSYQIEKALARNDVIQKQAPNEKPPLGDGIPWQSFPDSPPECLVGTVVPESAPVPVPVTYHFPDSPDADWTDTLVLRQENGNWVIDDIRYGTQGTLREVLDTVFDE